jgi:hypothetical protein
VNWKKSGNRLQSSSTGPAVLMAWKCIHQDFLNHSCSRAAGLGGNSVLAMSIIRARILMQQQEPNEAVRLQKIMRQHPKELERLDRLTRTGKTLHETKFAFGELQNSGDLERPASMPSLIRRMHLVQSFCICYGRLFSRGDAISFDKKELPQNLVQVHDQIVQLRNMRFAHDDRHPTVETRLDMTLSGDSVLVSQHLELRFPTGLPLSTRDLLDWLSDNFQTKVETVLRRLSSKTGLRWYLEPDE